MKRYSILPIEHKDLWERYKSAEAQKWNAQEVDLSQDKYESLTQREKEVLKIVLAFFVVSDGLVNENLALNITPEIDIPEAEFFYAYQVYNENVHNETYGLFIDRYYHNIEEKAMMFSPIENMETVRKKANWALDWIGNDKSLAHKIVAFSIVEGLFFSGLFSLVFYFRQGGKLAGLCQGNELILKDENSHYEFAVNLYQNHLKEHLSREELLSMILSAYEVEKTFIEETLTTGLPGLTVEKLIQYIQYVTDTILVDYGLNKYFNVSQPLEYMNRILMDTRSNFFESKSGTYTHITQSENLFDDDF
jgi:ribonucleoside-diphosphate reductase beta chain